MKELNNCGYSQGERRDDTKELQNTTPPLLQRLFDKPLLLLSLGLLVMFVFYTIWGLIEILSLPQAPLP